MFHVMERRHLINEDIRLIITPHPHSRLVSLLNFLKTENPWMRKNLRITSYVLSKTNDIPFYLRAKYRVINYIGKKTKAISSLINRVINFFRKLFQIVQ